MAVDSLCRKSFAIFAILFMISPGESQTLIFELKDRQFQEIIFSGDVTVAMICKITNVTTAEVTIAIDGENVATNNGQDNCLEFVISRIDSTDNINLTCSVSYNGGVNMPTVTETKTLILNVSERVHSCFRNGTGINQPYKVGDVLLLSCYCRVNASCQWTETVVKTELGRLVQPLEERVYNNKKISRILVGPFNDTNGPANDTYINTLRYDCSHGSNSDERCSIGPVGKSAGDFILNSTIPLGMPLECSVRENFVREPDKPSTTENSMSTSSKIKSTENSMSTSSKIKPTSLPESETNTAKPTQSLFGFNTDKMDGSIISLIIAIAGVFVLLIVLTVSIVVLLTVRRRKSKMKSTDEKEPEEVVTSNEKVDSDVYLENVADDSLDLYQNGDISHYGSQFARVVDNVGMDKMYGSESQVPVSPAFDNDVYANVDNDDDDDDQFQTADTSDYAVPRALMKDNMQRELSEAIGLYAQVKKHDVS